MNILKSILLGIIQGITEFLPISSSGHLAIFKKLFGLNLASGNYFDVMLHFGTLVAIIIVFHEDVLHMLQELWQMIVTIFVNIVIYFKRKKGNTSYNYFKVVNSNYKKLDVMIIVSTIPTGILGLFGDDVVDMASDILWFVGICLFITAGLLFAADKKIFGTKRLKNCRYSDAYFIGVAQGIATFPGISRSGATIFAGLSLGMNRQLAVKYSFLMSLPAVLGAVILKISHLSGEAFGSANLPGYVLGTIAAAVTGVFSLKWLLKLVKTKKYFGFAIYCVAAGLIAIIVSIVK